MVHNAHGSEKRRHSDDKLADTAHRCCLSRSNHLECSYRLPRVNNVAVFNLRLLLRAPLLWPV
jgi:hypothetical protein